MNKQNVICPYDGKFSAVGRNQVLIHTIIWMNFENIILNKKEARQKKPHMV